MKAIATLFLFFLLLSPQASSCQAVFFESMNDTLMRFSFDENYYLVDKNCEFKAIERVAGFDKETRQFHGEFKDFHVGSAQTILTGAYTNGKKTGDFKAYYPDGGLRWEATFVDDENIGAWKYYYPDGTPQLFLSFSESSFSIDQMWDKEGTQTVVDGKGHYSWDSPIIGFTEHGFTHYNRVGAVVNGFPNEAWPVVFSHPNGEKQTVGVEAFADGAIRDVIHTNFLRYYYGEDANLFAFSILPNDYFPRAEFLLPKGCTFDEFANFDTYLMMKFNRFLKECAETLEVNSKVTYKVRVNKNGLPPFRGLTSEETLDRQQRRFLRRMISTVNYYLPSYLAGKAASDVLTISFDAKYDENTKAVSGLQIHREKGE